MLTIYHNPKCSKSRQTLAIIEDNKKEVDIINYLKTPLNREQIEGLLSLLSCKPIEMMRTKESEFKELDLSNATDAQLIQAMVNIPKLMERPIVSNNKQAIIGRPPENVLALFG